MPISLFKDTKFEEINIDIEKGDRIFLYTDGLNELTKSENEVLSDEDFMYIVRCSNMGNLNATMDLMIENAINYKSKAVIHDDIVLIGFEIV